MTDLPDDALAPFDAHLDSVLADLDAALAAAGLEAVIVDAGGPGTWFLDDIASDWRCNPHFRRLTPLDPADECTILHRPGAVPVLLHLRPQDFWHLPPAPPSGPWTARFDIRPVADVEAREAAIADWLGNAASRTARIGPAPGALGTVHNPTRVLAHLDFHRARKTAWELACQRAAGRRAVAGHRAAAAAFEAGESEYGIHLAYLAATRHEDAELPYRNIVALDAHGAVLHYQHRERTVPAGGGRSLLIDAGAAVAGYAADVTRTHARAPGAFAELIGAVDALQRELVATIAPGLPWPDLHRRAHDGVARVLVDAGLARGTPEALVETGVTRAFLPHGLGHLIGVQTHDAGGRLVDAEGTEAPPPADHPALRLTRTLEPDWTVTVEPGLYFVPMLLDDLRATKAGDAVAWDAVDALAPFGGIRIEDDVRVTADGVENLTRDAFAAAAGAAS
jgi:Xaa-Pro dipeptidase